MGTSAPAEVMAPPPARTRSASTGGPATDEQLAQWARSGSLECFEELVSRYQVPLRHFLGRWCRGAEVEEAVQEAFVRAWEKLELYRPGRTFSTWLFTLARRRQISRWRERERGPRFDSRALESVEARSNRPEQRLEEEDERQALWRQAAAALSEPEVTALWLHYVEEMPLAEVARVLDRTSVAVKVMLFRARRKLRERLRLGAAEESGPRRRGDGPRGEPAESS